MLGWQYVSKGVCRCWHYRVSTAWSWRWDGSWSTPMVPVQLSVPLQQVEEYAPKPVRWVMCFLLTTSSLAWTLMIFCTSVYIYIYIYILCIYTVCLDLWYRTLHVIICLLMGEAMAVVACSSRALVVLYRMLTIFACYVLIFMFGMLFLFLTTSLGCFCPRILLFESRTEQVDIDLIYMLY